MPYQLSRTYLIFTPSPTERVSSRVKFNHYNHTLMCIFYVNCTEHKSHTYDNKNIQPVTCTLTLKKEPWQILISINCSQVYPKFRHILMNTNLISIQ